MGQTRGAWHAVFLSVAVLLAGLPAAAGAYPLTHVNNLPNRLVGQVQNVVGPGASPTGFTLQLGNQTADLKIVPATVFAARSAEAEVEGFITGDYALVVARRTDHGLVARRVSFDIQPFLPLRLVTGTLQRVSLNGRHVLVKLDNTRIMWLQITRQTRYRQDGKVVAIPPALTRGMQLQILAVRAYGAWVAADINIRTPATLRQG